MSAAEALSDLPDSVRNDPLFRQGYNLAADHYEEQLRHAGHGHSGGPAEASRLISSPARFGVASGVNAADLKTGVVVLREVTKTGRVWLTTNVPCCSRALRLPARPGDGQHAMCCRCGLVYAVAIDEEEPDGYSDDPVYVARFTVEHADVAAAMHHLSPSAAGWPR